MTLTQPTPQAVSILIVDDKPENLVALEELLKQPGRHIVRAMSGNEALRKLLKEEFAVVLLDVQMPDIDGYEVAQLMRSTERTRLVPIIFVTAGDRSEERTFRGYEAGAVDFLYKPIDGHILQSKVSVFVDLYRKTHELAAANAALECTTATLREKISDLENVSHTLAHDLRAPLRSIRAFTQILAESFGGDLDAEQADALERVEIASARVMEMIDGLYELLRVGAQEAPRSDVDLASVFAGVVESLRADIASSHAEVTSGELPTRVRTNRALIGQILQNLIANAIKYQRDQQAVVHVSAQRRVDAWELSVRDNGVGIAPADHERVFRLFERMGAKAGTGVGLALCKRAVDKLGGRIWLSSALGQGTTFYFTVPDSTQRGA